MCFIFLIHSCFLCRILNYYNRISVINTNLGSEEDDAVGPEEASFVEENVETEVSGERDETEDEGDQEEDTWQIRR